MPNKPRQRLNYLSKSWITTKKMVEMPTNVRNGDPTSLLFRIDLPRRRHSSNNKKSL
jgi:antirestriction protein ArdC